MALHLTPKEYLREAGEQIQPIGKTAFAGCHLPGNGSKRRDQLCHVAAIIEREDSPAAMNQYDRTLVLRFPARQPSLF